MTMNCEEARLSLGAHALGALEPDEAMELDAHLATCEACTVELMELSGLTDFLAKVSERDVELVTRPPRQVLDRLLNDRAKRHRRGRMLLAVAASVAVLAVGGTVWSTVQQQRGGTQTAASAPEANDQGKAAEAAPTPSPAASAYALKSEPSTASTAEADTRQMAPGLQFKGKDGKASATITATPGEQATAVTVTVDGVPIGTRCTVTVVSTSGATERAAVWTITKDEYERHAVFPGKTTIKVEDIARFDLTDANGTKLLSAEPVTR